MDLSKIVPGILLGFFIATVLAVGFTNMSTSFGESNSISNETFTFTNSLNAAREMENKTMSKGVDSTNTFFPALGTLFDIWAIIKSSLQDMTQTIENLVFMLGGDPLLVVFKTIIIAIIALGITFIILAALFRMGSWKIN